MLKKFIYGVIFLLSIPFWLFSQQRPQYTQYIFNNYLLNPALTGIENYIDIKAGHRAQWLGIDNAPTTSFISAHWALGNDYLWKNPLSLPETGDNPMQRSYMQNYMSSPAHHGIGVIGVSDKAGPISRVDAGLTYAYHLQLNGVNNLAVGVYAGVSRIVLDMTEIKLETAGDPALSVISHTQFKPDLGVGLWFYSGRFFTGLAAQQILSQRLSFTNTGNFETGTLVPHLFFTAGYKLFWDEDISVLPSFMVKRVEALPISVDANVKIAYQDKFWLGGSYRKSDSFSAMFGFNFKRVVNLTYGYDITTSNLNTISKGSHEIVLGFQLENVYQVFGH